MDLEPDDRLPAGRVAHRNALVVSKPIACSSAKAASSIPFSEKAGPGDLEADRQAAGRPAAVRRAGEPGGNRDRRDAGQRHRHRAVVGHVHRERVVRALAELERDRRRGRRDDEVALREGGPEVVRDLRPHALRAPVVGLVVAGGERERAEHDPALHLVAEALRARALVEVEQRPVAGPLPVADAVVAREVRRRLGGRDHVVGGDAVRGMRKPDLHDLAAELARSRSRVRSKTSATPGSTPSASEPSSRGHAEPQALQVGAARQARPPPAARARSSRRGRWPTRWRSSSAASVTSRVSGPHWSSDEANATIP